MIINFTPKDTPATDKPLGAIRTEELAPTLESLPAYMQRVLKWPRLEAEQIAADTLHFSDFDDYLEFDIFYQPRQHCEIQVYRGDDDLIQEIRRAIDPLMWGAYPDAKNPHKYCSPILKFDEGDFSIIVYDTYAPEDYLRNMLEQHFSGIRPLENMEVIYPYIDISVYDKKYIYGEYCPYDPVLNQDTIDCMTESEIAYSLWCLRSAAKELKDNFEFTDATKRRMRYIEAYFFQKAADFGVSVNKPSTLYRKPNYECEVWYKWWVDGFKKMMKEHSPEFDKWCETAEIGQPCPFRPEGDYVDLLDTSKIRGT